MELTIEERRARNREYYAQNREKICKRQRKRYKKLGKRYQEKHRERMREYKAKWWEEHKEEQRAKAKARWEARNTEEFRAQRRAAYATKHANDPMTAHRRACIEAQQKRMEKPLTDRKAEIMATKAEKAAKRDMQKDGYLQNEEKSERKRETVIRYIDEWTKRKVFASMNKGGSFMSEADINAYHKEACKYFEIQAKLDATDPKDYTTRNILSYKLRVIEEHFNTLLNKKLQTKYRLKSE